MHDNEWYLVWHNAQLYRGRRAVGDALANRLDMGALSNGIRNGKPLTNRQLMAEFVEGKRDIKPGDYLGLNGAEIFRVNGPNASK